MSTSEQLFEIGEVIGGTYEIRNLLGEGGMGVVYGAQDLTLSRRVAIKASRPLMDKTLLLKEAQAIASIRHPGMIDVYGAGEHRGIAYIVMEFLYGVDLESFLMRRRKDTAPFDVREAVDVLIHVGDALAAVHRSGIAHRDVKPGNIMLTPNGRVVLMDFGLFRPENTAASVLSGTPEYMAPESMKSEVDPRNAFYLDIYALGITAYELLAGDVPFTNEDPMATLQMQVDLTPADLRDLRPDVPPRLAALVAEMIAKEPLERPPSMEAIVFRLRAIREALEAPVHSQKFSVLVVDDDPALAKLIGLYARRAVPDATVVSVEDAEKALVAVRERPPDVMLLDLHMPRMNGIELCMMLRGGHLADQCTIIAVSAGARDADIDLLRQLGITRFVPKGGDLGSRITPAIKEIHDAWQRSKGPERAAAVSPPSGKQAAATSSPKLPAATEVRLSSRPQAPASRPPDAARLFGPLRTLAKLLPDAMVVVFDRDLRLVFAEGGALGADKRGGTLEEVASLDRKTSVRPIYEAALRGETSDVDIDGNVGRYRMQVVPLENEAGDVGWGMALVSVIPR
jgi:serine/threonine-protein kinase